MTFPILDRVRVNGRRAHPLFTELKRSRDSAGLAGPVVWNFEKFLVLPSGEVRRFRPPVEPDDPAIVQAIEAGLAASGRADAAAGGSGASA